MMIPCKGPASRAHLVVSARHPKVPSRPFAAWAFALFALCTSPAHAETRADDGALSDWYVAVTGFHAMPRDSDTSRPIDVGRLTGAAEYGNSAAFSAAVGRRVVANVRLELELGYSPVDVEAMTGLRVDGRLVDAPYGLTGDSHVWTLTLAASYDVPMQGPLRPYVGAGVGVAHHFHLCRNRPDHRNGGRHGADLSPARRSRLRAVRHRRGIRGIPLHRSTGRRDCRDALNVCIGCAGGGGEDSLLTARWRIPPLHRERRTVRFARRVQQASALAPRPRLISPQTLARAHLQRQPRAPACRHKAVANISRPRMTGIDGATVTEHRSRVH